MYSTVIDSTGYITLQIDLDKMLERIKRLKEQGHKTDEVFIVCNPFTRIGLKTGEQEKAFSIHTDVSNTKYPNKFKFVNSDRLRAFLKTKESLDKYGGRVLKTMIPKDVSDDTVDSSSDKD